MRTPALLAFTHLLFTPLAVLGWRFRDPLVLNWPQLPESGLLVEDDFDTVRFPQGSGTSTGIVQWSLNKTVPSTGRNYTIHVGSLSYGLPNTFSFQLPDGGKNLSKHFVKTFRQWSISDVRVKLCSSCPITWK